jgi:selenocysteine-specific elongation factor
MYVIGTSGHIDHGKTSLIRALTGIDCDRLPEEKAREMTIDIGFAHIEYPKLGTVSIIDVPGHERFIRNMVAGAWGIDLALLVIAVDDGWMPQTEDHFRVLSLLGVERLIVVLTKVDIADMEMISFVEEEAREKLTGTRYEGADIIRVSSKTGEGVKELKDLILQNLRKLNRASNAQKPYMFVDRVFASKGHGTIITGTLKNGVFRENDTVTLLPGGKELRIKAIESHGSALHEGVPSQRTALNLPGVSVEEIRRGHILASTSFFTETSDVLARIVFLDTRKEIKNNMGIELLVGTTAVKGKMILLDEELNLREGVFVRIRLERRWFFYPGQPFIITPPGGFRISGGGTIIVPDYESLRDKRRARGCLHLVGAASPADIIRFIVSAGLYAGKNDLLRMFPLNEKALDQTVAQVLEDGRYLQIDAYLADREFYEGLMKTIYETIERNVGLNSREIADRTGINDDFCHSVMPSVMGRYTVLEKEGRYFASSSITVDNLGDDRRAVLDHVRSMGVDGVELDRLSDEKRKKIVGELLRLGFLVSLDGNIVFHGDTYSELRERVMSLFNGKERITVPEAKDATGLSRKYVIPLLNRIETDGLIKRVGDFRIRS